MNRFSIFRFCISGLLGVALALLFTGCFSPQYTAKPPSESLPYMGLKASKGFYGGPWYGPAYEAPQLVVAPELPQS